MTINKEQALLRVAEIQSCLRELTDEAAALRKIIEAQEKVEKKPLVQAKNKYGSAVFHHSDGYKATSNLHSFNAFETEAQARAYAEAFNTLLDLRRQPGSEAAVDGKDQWIIKGDGNLFAYLCLESKISEICPVFDSEESALAARDAVGWDRILRMYNTLHGRGY